MNEEIRAYLLTHYATPANCGFSDEDSLLESGVLDSMAMVDLIAHLEDKYGVDVTEDDMTPENFDTVDAIAAYVRENTRDPFPASTLCGRKTDRPCH